MSEEVEAYVTKYALTHGVLKVRGKIFKGRGGCGFRFIREGEHISVGVAHRDWHRSEERARKRAEEIRNKEIKRLKRQLRDLRGLQF